MVLSKSERSQTKWEGNNVAGSGVEFLISAGSGEQRQDSVQARQGSTALIWVTGLWDTVITPLSSSGLKWCSWAWRARVNEPVHNQRHGHTFLVMGVGYIWNICAPSLAWVCGSISNTSESRLFFFGSRKRAFVQLQFRNMFGVKYRAHIEMFVGQYVKR